jgi:hypothetical protein
VVVSVSWDVWLSTHWGTASRVFVGKFYALRRILSAKVSDEGAITSSLRRTCTAADELLSDSIEAISLQAANTTNTKETGLGAHVGLISVTNALHSCYPTLLQALDKSFVEASIGQGAVFAIVLLFRSIIHHLHTLGATEAGTRTKAGNPVKGNNTRASRQQSRSASNIHELSAALTMLAIQFFEALDLSQISHNRVLEALVCVFLDHLGSSLSLVVFAESDVMSSKGVHLGILPPCGLLDTTGLDYQAATRTTECECRYLVAILQQLMLYIDKQESLAGSEAVPFLTLKRSSVASNRAFAARVRKKLQDTLLRGVFGDDDESFKDALRKPIVVPANDNVDIAGSGQGESKDWFIGEVWRLLGWNILTGLHRE